jgi:hypothetical protein
VQGFDRPLRQRLVLLHEVFQQQDGVLVVHGFQMLADGLPADGDAL